MIYSSTILRIVSHTVQYPKSFVTGWTVKEEDRGRGMVPSFCPVRRTVRGCDTWVVFDPLNMGPRVNGTRETLPLGCLSRLGCLLLYRVSP